MDITLNGSDDFGFTAEKYTEEAYNYLKQHMSMYQNLIPGESDEIFIPPTTAKHHSGPRALHVDMQTSETDSTQSTSETGKTPTISSYIKELKEEKSSGKRLNYSRAVQCVPLPDTYKNRKDLTVSDIIPTRDARHVLAILKPDSFEANSILILYRLSFDSKMVKMVEEPVLIRELCAFERPVEASLLVQLERAGAQETQQRPGPDGTLIVVCADGAVRIIKLATLRTASVARLEGEKFVSAVYCNSK